MPDADAVLPPLPPAWRDALGEPDLSGIRAHLARRVAAGAVIHPPAPLRFAALGHTPPGRVKAVVIGQDPYHGPGQAHGLAFSVPPGVRPPPSLRNILRELSDDLPGDAPPPGHGTLTAWADAGVLLLNTVLTVEDGQPGSHAGQGWEAFTRAMIRAVAAGPTPVAFLLWGAHAGRLADAVDASRHLVLSSAHPSPLSARRGFFGSRPFSRANAFLASRDVAPVDWHLR